MWLFTPIMNQWGWQEMLLGYGKRRHLRRLGSAAQALTAARIDAAAVVRLAPECEASVQG
jgi:hypothetical protein